MTGSGTVGDPYIIGDVNDLQAMQDELDAYYELGGNIDASITVTWNAGAGFIPVGTFTGSLDGNGYTVSDLFINKIGHDTGLFSYINGGTVTNLVLSTVDITGSGDDVGALSGQTKNATISDVITSGSVTCGDDNAGGLVGLDLSGSDIADCSSACTVTATDRAAGGLIGFCTGATETTCTRCFATGAVSGDGGVGGLFGISQNSAGAVVTQCYATGNVTGTGDDVGGLMGILAYGSVQDAYSRGTVAGIDSVGGCIGRIDATATIENAYSTGTVVGGIAGGFCGLNAGTITNCFWDTETSGTAVSDGGTGKTTAEMKSLATFPTWDFTTIWAFSEITTQAATNIDFTTATLNGLLDFSVYNDLYPILQFYAPLSDCTFQWGETIAYGNETAVQQKVTGQSFSQAIGGLVAGTTYHFRTHAAGSDVYGADMSFGTEPTVNRGRCRGHVLMPPVYSLILQGR